MRLPRHIKNYIYLKNKNKTLWYPMVLNGNSRLNGTKVNEEQSEEEEKEWEEKSRVREIE